MSVSEFKSAKIVCVEFIQRTSPLYLKQVTIHTNFSGMPKFIRDRNYIPLHVESLYLLNHNSVKAPNISKLLQFYKMLSIYYVLYIKYKKLHKCLNHEVFVYKYQRTVNVKLKLQGTKRRKYFTLHDRTHTTEERVSFRCTNGILKFEN